jgi:hypothetical protein
MRKAGMIKQQGLKGHAQTTSIQLTAVPQSGAQQLLKLTIQCAADQPTADQPTAPLT